MGLTYFCQKKTFDFNSINNFLFSFQMSLSQVHFLGVIKCFMEILSGDGESSLHAIDISEKHRRASVV